MKKLNTNIRIISTDGGDFANFFEKEDLFSKLSGVKDPQGENMEFIEIGNVIELNNQKLKVININLKFDNINRRLEHSDKTEILTPSNLIIETIITVKAIKD